MIIELKLTGNDRKELAKAISAIIGAPAEYQYMPTCAYKIGEDYTVTKEGNLEISDYADSKETERLLAELKSRGYDVPMAEETAEEREDAEENSTAFEELVGIDYEEEYIDDDARFDADYDAYLEFEWECETGR